MTRIRHYESCVPASRFRLGCQMAQHIGLRRESESGTVVAMFEAEGIPLEILDLAPSDSACTRFIDPYGDSVFNQLQLPVLIAELRAMSGNGSNLFNERLHRT